MKRNTNTIGAKGEKNYFDNQSKKFVLVLIKLGKALFYDTPVHRTKLANVVFERLFHAAYKKDTVVEVAYEGGIFKIPSKDISLLPSILNNNYEKYEISLFKKLLKPGDVMVDIGANIGLFSVIGSKSVGSSGKVYSFEPEPGNYALLTSNLLLNGATNVHTENLAIGDKKDTMLLQIEKNSIGSHSLIKRGQDTIEQEVKVDVVKLDDYFKDLKSEICVMKVDVEGYEPYVLNGAKKILARVEYLFFEYNRTDVEENFGISDMVGLLNSFPYLYSINEKTRKLKEFSDTDFTDTRYVNLLASRKKIAFA